MTAIADVGENTDPVEALDSVCGEIGLDPREARLLRLANNAVFHLARDPVVVRIVTLPSYVPRAEFVVAAATLFAEYDVPAIRLLPGIDQPVYTRGGHVATVWQAVEGGGPQPTVRDLARLLHAVHRVPAHGGELPNWDPLENVADRLRHTSGVAPDDREFLQRRSAELAAAAERLEYVLPRAVLHGDAHLGNVIAGPDGPVLCDFDSGSVGPPEWDLIPVAVANARFGPPNDHPGLAEAYGFDVTAWDGFEVLRGIRELKLVAGALPGPRSDPRVHDEFQRRITSLRAGQPTDRWVPLPR